MPLNLQGTGKVAVGRYNQFKGDDIRESRTSVTTTTVPITPIPAVPATAAKSSRRQTAGTVPPPPPTRKYTIPAEQVAIKDPKVDRGQDALPASSVFAAQDQASAQNKPAVVKAENVTSKVQTLSTTVGATTSTTTTTTTTQTKENGDGTRTSVVTVLEEQRSVGNANERVGANVEKEGGFKVIEAVEKADSRAVKKDNVRMEVGGSTEAFQVAKQDVATTSAAVEDVKADVGPTTHAESNITSVKSTQASLPGAFLPPSPEKPGSKPLEGPAAENAGWGFKWLLSWLLGWVNPLPSTSRSAL